MHAKLSFKKSTLRLHTATILHKLHSNNNHFPLFNSITNINPNLGIATAVEI
jgi:hypothetical protein